MSQSCDLLQKCQSDLSIILFFFFFFFFLLLNRHYNPGWISACSTYVEHSQQEGFTE
jgi:hypothetical protein